MQPLVPTPGFGKDRAKRLLVYDRDTAVQQVDDVDRISDYLETGDHFVWLDLAQPTPEDLAVLQREFGLHPTAVEDAALWHERPKIEFFENYVLVVAHAASLDPDGILVTHEIAIFTGARFIVTIRAFPLYPLDEIERRWKGKASIPHNSTGLLYTILDVIVDEYFPLTEAYDARLLRLESRLFDTERFSQRMEREMFRFRRALTLFRQIVVPMREMVSRLATAEVAPLEPGLTLYFRDVYDHVLRALEQIDTTRELVNSTFDVHLAAQTHRQNEVSKQLTIIATIFLPLTYITGFFGQNFGWMVNSVTSAETFWYLGVGTQVATLIALFWFFKAKRWF